MSESPDDAIVGRAVKWSAGVILLIGSIVALMVFALHGPDPAPPPRPVVYVPPARASVPGQAPDVHFTDVTREVGVDFIHVNGATGDKLLPETMGGGCAFFDLEGDGDQDLLLVNSSWWPDAPPSDEPAPRMGLYRNDGRGRFEDVTAEFGLDVGFYGMGVAVGDYDHDNDTDLFITAVGTNHLFRRDEGKFTDVTAAAGVGGGADRWSTGAAFVDYDRDGDLDLFVCNYVRWSREIDLALDYRFAGLGRAYGPPTNFEGAHPYLYQNDGRGSFADVTEPSGLYVLNRATGVPTGKGLAVAPIDVDDDGWIDLVVANDTTQNFLFHNRGDGTFTEMGASSGLGYDENGKATGAMGIDAGYYRDDDALGIVIGNFANEMTSLYVSQGVPLLFADQAISEGIGATTRLMLTFGAFLFDYDLDGRLDLLQVNGHLEEQINLVQPSQHYEQPAQLFWNGGPASRGCFTPVDPARTGDLGRPAVARGAAYADVDNDGDLDVLLTQVGRRPRLLRNDSALGHRCLRVKLVSTTANRDAIGAWVVVRIEGKTQRRQVMPTRSYLSQVELPVTFGLGQADRVDELSITWPDGSTETIKNLLAGSTHTLTQDRGVTATRPFQPVDHSAIR